MGVRAMVGGRTGYVSRRGFLNRFSVIMVNTNRTNIRTTLTSTHLKVAATLFAVALSTVTGVPYGPSVNNATGNRLIHRVSTLNNRVTGTTSTAFLRSEILGLNGKPTIRDLHIRSSEIGCRACVGGTYRTRRGLRIGRTRVARVVFGRNGISKIMAGLNAGCSYGTIVVSAKACLGNIVRINRIDCRDNPSTALPTGNLDSYLVGGNVGLHHFGANAPTQIRQEDVSFSGLRIRGNSRGVLPVDCRAGNRLGGAIDYCVSCAGRGARGVVLSGLRHSPLCTKEVRNMNPHCYPSVRSGVIHFDSGPQRRLFVRPVNISASRCCLRNVSSDLPRRIRFRFLHAVRNLRGIRVVQGTCTVRCSYYSSLSLLPALRFGAISKLCNTNRFGNASNCRRTTTRKLVTNVGTSLGLVSERRVILSQTASCVNALVSSLIAGKMVSPCHVVASQDRCHLLLHRSGTSRQLARVNCGMKLVSRRECRQAIRGCHLMNRRIRHLRRTGVKPDRKLGSCLISYKARNVAGNSALTGLVHQPRIDCRNLTFYSPGHPRLPRSMGRRTRLEVGCSNCVGVRLRRIRTVQGLRRGVLPRSTSCGGVRNLQLRTERGLAGVHPQDVNRTSEVSNMGPTSISILLV